MGIEFVTRLTVICHGSNRIGCGWVLWPELYGLRLGGGGEGLLLGKVRVSESMVAIIAAGVSLFGALLTAAAATITSLRLAKSRERAEKRALCLNLQQQFDSPPMFKHRYQAWKTIEDANLPERLSVGDLFENYWDESVSAVVHFFESLEQYCGEDLIDRDLAVALFGRPYQLWDDILLSRLEVDEGSQYYLPWLTGVRAFRERVGPHADAVRIADPGPESAALTGESPGDRLGSDDGTNR